MEDNASGNCGGIIVDLAQSIVALEPTPDNQIQTAMAQGKWVFYHFGCQGIKDFGWGCAYRCTQSLCSYLRLQMGYISRNGRFTAAEPRHSDIQQILIDNEDKPASFLGSREWIGSFEACLVLDTLYDVPCKIIHLQPSSSFEDLYQGFRDHFLHKRTPIMMGGSTSAFLIVGVRGKQSLPGEIANVQVLVADPHYCGQADTIQQLYTDGAIAWKSFADIQSPGAFYNFCLPQIVS